MLDAVAGAEKFRQQLDGVADVALKIDLLLDITARGGLRWVARAGEG